MIEPDQALSESGVSGLHVSERSIVGRRVVANSGLVTNLMVADDITSTDSTIGTLFTDSLGVGAEVKSFGGVLTNLETNASSSTMSVGSVVSWSGDSASVARGYSRVGEDSYAVSDPHPRPAVASGETISARPPTQAYVAMTDNIVLFAFQTNDGTPDLSLQAVNVATETFSAVFNATATTVTYLDMVRVSATRALLVSLSGSTSTARIISVASDLTIAVEGTQVVAGDHTGGVPFALFLYDSGHFGFVYSRAGDSLSMIWEFDADAGTFGADASATFTQATKAGVQGTALTSTSSLAVHAGSANDVRVVTGFTVTFSPLAVVTEGQVTVDSAAEASDRYYSVVARLDDTTAGVITTRRTGRTNSDGPVSLVWSRITTTGGAPQTPTTFAVLNAVRSESSGTLDVPLKLTPLPNSLSGTARRVVLNVTLQQFLSSETVRSAFLLLDVSGTEPVVVDRQLAPFVFADARMIPTADADSADEVLIAGVAAAFPGSTRFSTRSFVTTRPLSVANDVISGTTFQTKTILGVVTAVRASGNVDVTVHGVASGLSGLVPGKTYYGDTNGTLVTNQWKTLEPTGELVRLSPVGMAVSSTSLLVALEPAPVSNMLGM